MRTFYNVEFDSVLYWNVVNFMYKSAFIKNEILEESMKSKR